MPDPRTLLAATRPRFLTASLLPVLIGSTWGARAMGGLDVQALGLALLATALVHAASNVYNDISDELLGTDRANTLGIPPYTGGSRLIQEGAITVADMRRLALFLTTLALLAGGALAVLHGPVVLAFGLAGGGLGAAYSRPGVRLCGRGIGEAAIAAAFGVLPVTGAAWLQTGLLDLDALWLSLPVSCWVAGIIIANEIPDAPADGATGKRTLAVRLGPRTPALYAWVQLAACLAWALIVARGMLPAWSLVVPAGLLALALGAARNLTGDRARLTRGIQRTLLIHAAGCVSLVVLTGVAASG
jgi:1,4-dihydroxy-2-naphthoate polyprenyltransferase